MGLQDFFTWRSQSCATSPAVADEDIPADVDEPPDTRIRRDQSHPDFHKSLIRPQSTRKESLLTKAFHAAPESESEMHKSDLHISTDMNRRRSMMSNASIASTAELTSDGGLTSPARTNTPSPPFPNTTFTSLAPFTLPTKTAPVPANTKTVGHTPLSEVMAVSPKARSTLDAPKKRCISFMCDGKKEAAAKAKQVEEKSTTSAPAAVTPPQPRRCTIKFACPGPKAKAPKEEPAAATQSKQSEGSKRNTSRSPSLPRKSPRQVVPSRTAHRDSSSALRKASQSPVATRVKPRYIVADEKTINASEATRFHEFASEVVEEDDWIRRDAEIVRAKLTINDTLKKENAIRQLGTEAEAEALEDEEDEDDGNDSDDENEDEDEDEDEEFGEDDEEDQEFFNESEDDVSDGNESDNEAGFAESDESDGEGDFSFWTPGRKFLGKDSLDALVYRPSAHRTASTSSIDSLNHMEPESGSKRLRRRPIKIRPGTPDLPDSTDFVCGTLDEDRPLEDAYVSCMEARKHAKHKQTPQDIDPSFPTSDIEDEEDEDDIVDTAHDSDEPVWLHGKFEESDEERHGRRRSTITRRKSPAVSPRRLHSPPPPRRLHSPAPKQRLHSPPPPKQRLRSPPPRKLFGHSPKRMQSPTESIRSPAGSPTSAKAIMFAPLGSRPGLTHTKSLPRTPNAFCRQYRASRLIAANGNALEGSDNNNGHVRGAIDIVKGLEEKRQRRKEKFHQKQCNRKNKGHSERRPQPGKGAERMRELGLLMAGKTGQQDPYMLSA